MAFDSHTWQAAEIARRWQQRGQAAVSREGSREGREEAAERAGRCNRRQEG